MAQSANSGGIKTMGTIFDILETLTTEERMMITEIAERVDVPKGTVHAHLQTLKERGISFKRTTSTTDWDFGSSLS